MPLTGYDEVCAPSGAQRPAVAGFEARTGVSAVEPSKRFVDALRSGDADNGPPILPVPLVLPDAEYVDVIAPGVRQRARAMRALFHDLFAGPQLVVRAGAIDPTLVDVLTERAGWTTESLRRRWAGTNLADVCFVHGADLLRDPDGRWVVLEDNVGCVGGMVDATRVLTAYLRAAGTSLHPCVPLPDDLGEAVSAFLRSVGVTATDPGVVALAGQASPCGDFDETRRKVEVLTSLGLLVVDRGMFAAEVAAGAQYAAVVDLGGEVDVGGAPALGAPGSGLLADKALLPVMDEVIRTLLGEEPILATPATRLIDRLTDHTRGVLKRVDGCGGNDVFVLDDHAFDRRDVLDERLAAWGKGGAVLQDLVEASTLPSGGPGADRRYRVELRPIAYAVGDDVLVSEVPVGRAVPLLGDRRGNITQGASYVAVVREPVA